MRGEGFLNNSRPDGLDAAAVDWQIVAMRRTLQLMGRPSAADALRALRSAYPETPLRLRVAAVGTFQ